MMLDWLEIARNQAEERFRSLPVPTNKEENFRHSAFTLPAEGASAVPTPVPADLSTLDGEEAALVCLQGEDATTAGEVPGALFTDLFRAAVLGSELVRSRLRDAALFPQDKFAQLAAARWRNGAFLHVPAGVRLAKPVRAAVLAQGAEDHSRHLVQLEDGAEAVFVLETASDEQERFVTELTEVRLGPGAKLHWVILQRYGSATNGALRHRIELGAGAELKITSVQLGGGQLQLRQEANLLEDSRLELEGAARGDGSQQMDFWVDVDHAGSRSESLVQYHLVMGASARAVFNGLVQIRPTALDCNAAQKAKSLLLGPKAMVHAIPKLIIQIDAVKCSHGASVASVSPEQWHYLQSRGIPRGEAESMIVRGFTEPVLERLPIEALHARASAALDRKQGGWLQ